MLQMSEMSTRQHTKRSTTTTTIERQTDRPQEREKGSADALGTVETGNWSVATLSLGGM